MNILGIESTCDETGFAIVRNGREVLINLLASSARLQSEFGGVVPELAAREQISANYLLMREILNKVNVKEIDAIAVSYGPGLIGSLVIGVESAKTLAYSLDKPLIGVNHLVGHFFANWINRKEEIEFPAIALIVSGGHTDLLLFKNLKNYELLGSTLDDAAGEAFDKIAKFLNLGYPGGPAIEEIAKNFADKAIANPLPIPLKNADNFNFSFSGLKTAVINFANKSLLKDVEKISFLFQENVVDVLVSKTLKAAEKYSAKSVIVGGGVAANQRLRELFTEKIKSEKLYFPEKSLSVDNGAMIGAAAYFQKNYTDPLKLVADSALHF